MRKGRQITKAGRWYAMPGEAGLVMTTWPKGGAEHASGSGSFDVAVGYFNECMNGFEYQVASHMIYEGKPDSELVERGLAITRAVHDRYSPERRNPYNEIECSDHYSRSMAGYGVFLALCGFEYHGPKQYIRFAPRLQPDDFRAAFTAAEGWGTFSQDQLEGVQTGSLQVRYGKLLLRTLGLSLPQGCLLNSCAATLDSTDISVTTKQQDENITIEFDDTIAITEATGALKIRLSYD